MLILLCIAAYFLLLIGIGLHAGRSETDDGFIIGSRKVGYLPTIGSITCGFRDSAGLAFWIGMAGVIGYGGLWYFAGMMTAAIVYAVIGPRMRAFAAQNNYITINQIVRGKIGPLTEKATSLCLLFVCVIGIAIQIYLTGNLFAVGFGLPEWAGIVSVAAVMGTYLYFGGYATVIRTDLLQFAVFFVILALPFFVPPARDDVLDFSSVMSMDAPTTFAFFMIGVLYMLADGGMWQRVLSARSANVIRAGYPLAVVFSLIVTVPAIWLGLGLKPFATEIGDHDMIYGLFFVPGLPQGILAAFSVALLAMSMSTMDTLAYVFSSTLVKNFLPARLSHTRADYVRTARCALIGLLVLTVLSAFGIEDLIGFMFATIGVLYICAPVFVFCALGLFRGPGLTDRLLGAGVGAALAVFAALFASGALGEMIYTIIPAGVSLLFCLIAAVLSRLKGNTS